MYVCVLNLDGLYIQFLSLSLSVTHTNQRAQKLSGERTKRQRKKERKGAPQSCVFI